MDQEKLADEASPPDRQNKGHEPPGGFKYYLRIFGYADSLSATMYWISFFGAICSGAALPLMTIVFGSFTTKFSNFAIGQMSPADFKKQINSFVIYFIYIFVGRFVLTYISSVLVTVASIRTTKALRRAFFANVLRKEIWYFDVHSTGSITTQVTTNGNKINQGTADKMLSLVQGIATFLSAFVVALAIQWKLALITLTCVPLIFIITSAAIAYDAPIESKLVKTLSRGAQVAEETIASISTVQAFWAQDKLLHKYEQFLHSARKQGSRKSIIFAIIFSNQYFNSYAAVALAFWQGSRMYRSGEIEDVGKVLTVVLSVLIAATSVAFVAPQIQFITIAASAASELFQIIDRDSQLDPLDPCGTIPASCEGHIEVQNLNFAYPARPSARILNNLSLDIPAGKTTALVGPSGCGKSTLVGLIERWYIPESGQLLLDGKDIATYNTRWLRNRIRLVQQEPTLFSGTVSENVSMGLLDEQRLLSVQEQSKLVEAACEASYAHNFIMDLPQGYNTVLGESAGMLSGGQRQRLAIARSIISNPSILLLDEATSAIDPRAESIVQKALQSVSQGRTVLVIAHKLSTVKAANKIAVIANGTVLEQGTHQQLLDKGGNYTALVRAQNLGRNDHAIASKSDFPDDEPESPTLTVPLTKTKSVGYSVIDEVQAHDPSVKAGSKSLFRCIFIVLKEQRSLYYWFAFSIIGVLVGGATFPGQALLFARLINVFPLQGADATSQANFYSLMLFIVAIGNLICYSMIGWACNVIGQTVAYNYRREMFATILKQDKEFFDQLSNTSSALVSRISLMPQQLQELISANILLILIVIVNLVSSCALALAYGWKLALVVIAGGLPPLLVSAYIRARLEQSLALHIEEQFYESAGLASEAVIAIKTVASLTAEEHFLNEYSTLLANIAEKTILATFHTMFWAAFAQSFEFLMMALGFWYGGHLLANGEYTSKQFFTIFISVLFAGQAASQFTSYSTSLSKAADAANYIFWLRTLKPSIAETKSNQDNGPGEEDGTTELQDLQFRYKQRMASRVLHNVSMIIEPGQSVAFVGASGCGKSTMISLLERLYDPTFGRICLAGNDISTMSPRLYRQQMSLVMQQPILFKGSIRDNISLSLEHDPTDEEIYEACRQANALDFVQTLPEGLGTACGSQGLQFSGGQRQRIAIARALIRKPRLLLLDEATSALDTQSERLVQATLDKAAATRTMVSVAHRLSTIRNADCIYVFADGRIAEAGTHSQLLDRKGLYYGMCLTQSLDMTDV